MVSSCTPETGGLASHWTLPESETKFAFGIAPPPQTRHFGRSEGFVPEIDLGGAGLRTRGRANRRSTVPKVWTASATRP